MASRHKYGTACKTCRRRGRKLRQDPSCLSLVLEQRHRMRSYVLQWSGVASRGKLAGKKIPVPHSEEQPASLSFESKTSNRIHHGMAEPYRLVSDLGFDLNCLRSDLCRPGIILSRELRCSRMAGLAHLRLVLGRGSCGGHPPPARYPERRDLFLPVQLDRLLRLLHYGSGDKQAQAAGIRNLYGLSKRHGLE